jgi:hypothetical protein
MLQPGYQLNETRSVLHLLIIDTSENQVLTKEKVVKSSKLIARPQYYLTSLKQDAQDLLIIYKQQQTAAKLIMRNVMGFFKVLKQFC